MSENKKVLYTAVMNVLLANPGKYYKVKEMSEDLGIEYKKVRNAFSVMRGALSLRGQCLVNDKNGYKIGSIEEFYLEAVNAFTQAVQAHNQGQRSTWGPATPYRAPTQSNPFIQPVIIQQTQPGLFQEPAGGW